MTTPQLVELLTELRKLGVHRFADKAFRVTFFPDEERIECGKCGLRMLPKVLGGHECSVELKPEKPEASAPATELPEATDRKCACGHPTPSEHTEHGCGHGCPPDLCNSRDRVEPVPS